MSGNDANLGPTGLVIRVAGTHWFIPVDQVVEVLRQPRTARVPAVDSAVLGLVNHRGRVLTLADPARGLAMPGQGSPNGDAVVVEAGSRRFAVAVDGIVELGVRPRTGLAMLDLDQLAEAVFG